jgi:hypothetical protein
VCDSQLSARVKVAQRDEVQQLVQRRAHSKALCGYCRRERAPSASTLAPSAEGCDARAAEEGAVRARHRGDSAEFLGARPLRKRLNLTKRPPTPLALDLAARSRPGRRTLADAICFVFLHTLKQGNLDVELGAAQVTHKHAFKNSPSFHRIFRGVCTFASSYKHLGNNVSCRLEKDRVNTCYKEKV